MSRLRKPMVALLIAVVVFASFVIATNFYLSQNISLVNVVVAAEAIQPRTEIRPEMLKIESVPKGYLPEGYTSNIDMFTNNTFYSGEIGLHAGEILTRDKAFTEEQIAHSYAMTLAPDKTILGVSTNLIRSAGAAVYTGSRVRALAYIPAVVERGEIIKPSNVEVIFDDLNVIGIINSEGSDTSVEDQKRKIPSVVQLEVSHEQERVLIKYQEEYNIWFVVLPENYEPDPNIQDYYYRVKQGKEEEIHTYPENQAETEPVSIIQNNSPARTLP